MRSNPYEAPRDEELAKQVHPVPTRLRLAIMWIGFTALLIGFHNWSITTAASTIGSVELGPLWKWRLFLQSAVWALAFVAAWRLLETRSHPNGLIRHPGHWLLLFVVTSVATLLLPNLTMVWTGFAFIQIIKVVCWLPIVVATLAVYWNRGVWRIVFLTPIVFIFLARLGGWMSWNSYLSITEAVLQISLVGYAIVSDSSREDRDWLHWTGVGTFLFLLASAILTAVSGIMFMMQQNAPDVFGPTPANPPATATAPTVAPPPVLPAPN